MQQAEVEEYFHFYNKSDIPLIKIQMNEKIPLQKTSWLNRDYTNKDVMKYLRDINFATNGMSTGNFSFIIPEKYIIIDLDLKHLKHNPKKFESFIITKFLKYFPEFYSYIVGRPWEQFFVNSPFIVVRTPNKGYHIYTKFKQNLNLYDVKDVPMNPLLFKVDDKCIIEFKYSTIANKNQLMCAGSTIIENGLKKGYEIISDTRGGINIHTHSIKIDYDKVILAELELRDKIKIFHTSQNNTSVVHDLGEMTLEYVLYHVRASDFRGDYDSWKRFFRAIAYLVRREDEFYDEDVEYIMLWCTKDSAYRNSEYGANLSLLTFWINKIDENYLQNNLNYLITLIDLKT